jgi:hypothetical protein
VAVGSRFASAGNRLKIFLLTWGRSQHRSTRSTASTTTEITSREIAGGQREASKTKIEGGLAGHTVNEPFPNILKYWRG